MAVAEALERDPHTIGPSTSSERALAFGEGGPAALIFEQTGGSPLPPPALDQRQQAELKKAVQLPPSSSGLELANWSLRQAQEAGGAAVRMGAVRPQPEPQQLLELSAPVGIQLQASQEALGQGQ